LSRKRNIALCLNRLVKTLAGCLLDGDRFEGRFRDGVQLHISITGGARIHPELIFFFGSLGISLYQGYGMTETSPVTHVSTPEHNKIGFIGKPICHA
jgi:acyl-CoA synthetase (AMP-forming)/AMP-acid ligase II